MICNQHIHLLCAAPTKEEGVEDVLCPNCSYINGNVQSDEEKSDAHYSVSVGGNSDDLLLEEGGDEILADDVLLDISKCLFHSILNVCLQYCNSALNGM